MKILCLLGVLLLQGCGENMFLGSTKASALFPDGRAFNYENNRDFQGLDVTYDPSTGLFHLKMDKSGTPEAAMAAQSMAILKALEILESHLNAVPKPGMSFNPAVRDKATQADFAGSITVNDLPCGLNLYERQCPKYIPEKARLE